MSEPTYVEEIFENFYKLAIAHRLLLSKQDYTATHSLYEYCISDQKFLTANQANYLLKILARYQKDSADLDLDYRDDLKNPQWKKPFRTLDLTKRVFVEVDSEKRVWICLKFPYSLKETFDNEVKSNKSNSENNRWDHERKLRLVEAYKHNVMHINDFVNHHNFDIDTSFLDLVSQVEEIWQQQDDIIPKSTITEQGVVLLNTSLDTENYFIGNKTGDKDHDIFLAKTMGFPVRLDRPPQTVCEVISSKDANQFWLKEFNKFFELYKSVGGVACIIVDRNTKDVLSWLNKFVSEAEKMDCKKDIKICFRDSNEGSSKLNSWIKENNLGGKVEEGKIFVFLQKPHKWLFKNKIDVKIIGTNCYVPPLSDSITANWLFNHPCLCYLGDVKPTVIRNFKIVGV